MQLDDRIDDKEIGGLLPLPTPPQQVPTAKATTTTTTTTTTSTTTTTTAPPTTPPPPTHPTIAPLVIREGLPEWGCFAEQRMNRTDPYLPHLKHDEALLHKMSDPSPLAAKGGWVPALFW